MTEEKDRVLIIEDNEVVGKLAVALLSKHYAVQVASNGVDGLVASKSFNPQAILLDYTLPDMDGYKVCRRLKEDYQTKDIPVIIATGKTDTVDRIEGLEYGAADYVSKPYDHAELLARVAIHVRMKKTIDELLDRNRILEELVKMKP